MCPDAENVRAIDGGVPFVVQLDEVARRKSTASAENVFAKDKPHPHEVGVLPNRRKRGVDAMLDYMLPRYKVLRDADACVQCGVCERSCSNEVHRVDGELGRVVADHARCVNCQRCVVMCPTQALAIANWPQVGNGVEQLDAGLPARHCQAGADRAVLLASMGNPQPYPVYWDHLLLNASQVTNPSIDPLREPMETRVFLGAAPMRSR